MSNLIIEQALLKRGVTREQLAPKRVEYEWEYLESEIPQIAFGLSSGVNRIGILYDPDVDGLMSGFILKDYLESIGIDNIATHMNHNKVHGFKEEAQQWAYDEELTLIFIVDAGSGDTEYMKPFADRGVKFVVIDHHDYETPEPHEHIIILNASDHEPIKEISGCGAVYLFIESLNKLYDNNIKRYEKYVGVTILSDICSMTDAQNRYFVEQAYLAIKAPNTSPLFSGNITKRIRFWGSWHSYLAYTISPFLNAMIRCNFVNEVVELSNHFERNSFYKAILPYEHVKDVQKVRQDKIIELSEQVDLPGLTILMRPKQEFNYRPYNGVVANQVLRELSTNMMVVEYNPDSELFEGSFRGLDIGKTELAEWGIEAQGHEQACGVRFSQEVFVDLYNNFNHTISVTHSADIHAHSTTFTHQEMVAVAYFNEFTGKDLEKITIRLDDQPQNMESLQRQDRYHFEGLSVIDFGGKRSPEEEMNFVIEPTRNSNTVQYIRR